MPLVRLLGLNTGDEEYNIFLTPRDSKSATGSPPAPYFTLEEFHLALLLWSAFPTLQRMRRYNVLIFQREGGRRSVGRTPRERAATWNLALAD